MRQGGCRWRVRALPHGRFGYTNQTAADSGRLQADVLVRPDERAGEADGRLPEFAYPRARAAVPRGELCARAVRRKFRQSVRPTAESCVRDHGRGAALTFDRVVGPLRAESCSLPALVVVAVAVRAAVGGARREHERQGDPQRAHRSLFVRALSTSMVLWCRGEIYRSRSRAKMRLSTVVFRTLASAARPRPRARAPRGWPRGGWPQRGQDDHIVAGWLLRYY